MRKSHLWVVAVICILPITVILLFLAIAHSSITNFTFFFVAVVAAGVVTPAWTGLPLHNGFIMCSLVNALGSAALMLLIALLTYNPAITQTCHWHSWKFDVYLPLLPGPDSLYFDGRQLPRGNLFYGPALVQHGVSVIDAESLGDSGVTQDSLNLSRGCILQLSQCLRNEIWVDSVHHRVDRALRHDWCSSDRAVGEVTMLKRDVLFGKGSQPSQTSCLISGNNLQLG